MQLSVFGMFKGEKDGHRSETVMFEDLLGEVQGVQSDAFAVVDVPQRAQFREEIGVRIWREVNAAVLRGRCLETTQNGRSTIDRKRSSYECLDGGSVHVAGDGFQKTTKIEVRQENSFLIMYKNNG